MKIGIIFNKFKIKKKEVIKMTKAELKLLKLENRYRHMETRGGSEASSGVMRKVARQIRTLKTDIEH